MSPAEVQQAALTMGSHVAATFELPLLQACRLLAEFK
jgi:hypothetical protein